MCGDTHNNNNNNIILYCNKNVHKMHSNKITVHIGLNICECSVVWLMLCNCVKLLVNYWRLKTLHDTMLVSNITSSLKILFKISANYMINKMKRWQKEVIGPTGINICIMYNFSCYYIKIHGKKLKCLILIAWQSFCICVCQLLNCILPMSFK